MAPALHLQLEKSSGSRDTDMQLLRSIVDHVSPEHVKTPILELNERCFTFSVFSASVFGRTGGSDAGSLPGERGALPAPAQVRVHLAEQWTAIVSYTANIWLL